MTIPHNTDLTTAFVKEVAVDAKHAIKLITSIDPDGNFFYAYLLLKADLLPYLDAGLRTRNVDLEEYGVILASGEGLEPDPEVKLSIENKLKQNEFA